MKNRTPLKNPTMAVLTALAMMVGVTQPVVAHADPAPPEGTITGIPSLPALPEADNAATQQMIDQGVDMLRSQPLMQNAEKHANATSAPLDTSSTNPTCAPLIMVGVPGTFETDRAQDPNKPTGLLGSLAEPMRQQGGFSETYIPYTADAGVSGTSYAKSVQYGTEKTVNTITDISTRCEGSRIVLTGFSQGADIAGDVATMIGNKQVPVDPAIIAGVVLFADPQRAENSNILVGSSNVVPTMPEIVGKAVENVISDPSLAQQMVGQQINLSGLAAHLLNGATPQQQSTSPTPATTSTTAAPTTAPQAGEKAPTSEETAAPQAGEAAPAGEETTAPNIDLMALNVDLQKNVALDDSANDAEHAKNAEAKEMVTNLQKGNTLELQEKVSTLYRQGGCGDQTYSACLDRFNRDGSEDIDALIASDSHGLHPSTAGMQIDKDGNLTPGFGGMRSINLITTQCYNLPAKQCSQVPSEPALPIVPDKNTAQQQQAPAQQAPAPEPKQEPTAQPAPAQQTPAQQAPKQQAPKQAPTTPTPQAGQSPAPQKTSTKQTAGQTPKKTTTHHTTSTTTSPTAPQAGDKARPTTTTPYTGTLGGATTKTIGRDYAEVPVDPIITSAVSGGGIAGERDQDFGELTGSVVSLCVPGDIVCSLPANSQLAKDLVEIGQQVSTNLTGAAKATTAGNSAMGGFLALQAVNSIFSLSGLPTINLSAETIEALILIVGGATMLANGDPTGAGAAMLTSALPLLPTALPEVWQFLQTLPELLAKLKDAPDQLAKNLHIGEIRGELKNAFESAGLNDITDLTQIPPQAGLKAASLILQENSGLMELATNPDYLRTGAHSEQGFRDLILTEDKKESFTWSQDYMHALDDMID